MIYLIKFIFTLLIRSLFMIGYCFLSIVIGKLPKVSPYHIIKYDNFTIFNVWKDDNLQGKYYHPKYLKYNNAIFILSALHNNNPEIKKYLNISIPIKNIDGKVIGEQSLFSKLINEIDNFKELKNE